LAAKVLVRGLFTVSPLLTLKGDRATHDHHKPKLPAFVSFDFFAKDTNGF
jgi:hypothetical protein